MKGGVGGGPDRTSTLVVSAVVAESASESSIPLIAKRYSLGVRAALDAPDRKAALFRLEVPADAFKPGLYTCQVNVIDGAAGKFAFPRLAMLVR